MYIPLVESNEEVKSTEFSLVASVTVGAEAALSRCTLTVFAPTNLSAASIAPFASSKVIALTVVSVSG